MSFTLVQLSALVFPVLAVLYLRGRSAERTHAHLAWAAYALGAVTLIPAAWLGLRADATVRLVDDHYLRGLADAFLSAALPEQLVRFLVVWWFCERARVAGKRIDPVVCGASVALGFAMVEGWLHPIEDHQIGALVGAGVAMASHGFDGMILGYFIRRALDERERKPQFLALALAVPLTLHTLYDFTLMTEIPVNPAQQSAGPTPAAMLLTGLSLGILMMEAVWAIHLLGTLRYPKSGMEAGDRFISSNQCQQDPWGVPKPPCS